MSPIPFLAAAVILGFYGYEVHQRSHHVTTADLLPSAVALLAVAVVFSLLMGWIARKRRNRRRRASSMRSSGGSAAYPQRYR